MIEDPFDYLRDRPNTLRFHLDNPGVDVHAYARRKRIELGQSLLSKKRLYLDTMHWIHLRDVSMTRAGYEQHLPMFERLATLVDRKRAICPISYSIYAELMRQSDATTRKATARIIDRFGDSCCIKPPHDVTQQEVICFLRRAMEPNRDFYSVAEMVWTKVTAVVGEHFLTLLSPEIPEHVKEAMAKSMDDLLWSVKLEEVIDRMPIREPENLELVAKQLNAGKFANQNFTTFDEVFLHEIAGIVDCHREMLGDMLVYLSRRVGFSGTAPRDEIQLGGKVLANLIYSAFKSGRCVTDFPGIHIPAALHAAVRFDKNRAYKPGDCEDFRHAAVALPYFDVFFTEKSLKHLLCHKPLEFDKAYKTRVVAGETETLDALDSLDKDAV
jgi:hypothetical protein